MFTQTSHQVKISVMTMKENNLPSQNVTIMVGILHVGNVRQQPDGRWRIESLWAHAFPFGTDVKDTRDEAIKELITRLTDPC